jgi:hypothetical protein
VNGLAVNLKRGIFLLVIPFLYYATFSFFSKQIATAGVMDYAEATTIIYYFFYLIYVPYLDEYNCMSVIRFHNSIQMLGYFYRKTIPHALLYAVYMTAAYGILSSICRFSFSLQSAFQFLFLNMIALLILNFLCVVIGMKFGKGLPKPIALVYVLVMYAFLYFITAIKSSYLHTGLLISIFNMFSVDKFAVLDVLIVALVYCIHIFTGFGLYCLIKRDRL